MSGLNKHNVHNKHYGLNELIALFKQPPLIKPAQLPGGLNL